MDVELYRRVGKLTRDIREKARSWVKPGSSYLELAEKIEGLIRDGGARPAFPVNISVNDIAAHYTPSPGDESVFEKNDLVKVDFGAHLDGYPSDNAFTVCAGCSSELIKVADEALELAVSLCMPGVRVGEIGRQVEELITSYGYRPISNLSGHSMEQWNLHSGLSIPNVNTNGGPSLEEGLILAIEPFVTNGGGRVVESKPSSIYRLLSKKTRLPRARKLIDIISEEFGTLPFCSRWVPDEFLGLLPLLVKQGVLHNYPVLREIHGGLVSQAETTVLVSETPEVLV